MIAFSASSVAVTATRVSSFETQPGGGGNLHAILGGGEGEDKGDRGDDVDAAGSWRDGKTLVSLLFLLFDRLTFSTLYFLYLFLHRLHATGLVP